MVAVSKLRPRGTTIRVQETRGTGRKRTGEEARGENVGLLLFYVSLCSHSRAASEPSKSRLIDATKPTRASRRDATRVVVCPTFLHNSRLGGEGRRTRKSRAARWVERRGETRGERVTLFARITRDLPLFRNGIFFNCTWNDSFFFMASKFLARSFSFENFSTARAFLLLSFILYDIIKIT